jgi:hypothetical protein
LKTIIFLTALLSSAVVSAAYPVNCTMVVLADGMQIGEKQISFDALTGFGTSAEIEGFKLISRISGVGDGAVLTGFDFFMTLEKGDSRTTTGSTEKVGNISKWLELKVGGATASAICKTTK